MPGGSVTFSSGKNGEPLKASAAVVQNQLLDWSFPMNYVRNCGGSEAFVWANLLAAVMAQ